MEIKKQNVTIRFTVIRSAPIGVRVSRVKHPIQLSEIFVFSLQNPKCSCVLLAKKQCYHPRIMSQHLTSHLRKTALNPSNVGWFGVFLIVTSKAYIYTLTLLTDCTKCRERNDKQETNRLVALFMKDMK